MGHYFLDTQYLVSTLYFRPPPTHITPSGGHTHTMSYMREACFISLLWILHTSFSLYIYVKLYTHTVIRVIKNLLGKIFVLKSGVIYLI